MYVWNGTSVIENVPDASVTVAEIAAEPRHVTGDADVHARSGAPDTESVMVPETVPHGSTAQSGGVSKSATGWTSLPSEAAA